MAYSVTDYSENILPKPLFILDPDEYGWVRSIRNKRETAIIWKDRYIRLEDAAMHSDWPDRHFYKLESIIDELYRRYSALKYPSMMYYTPEQEWLRKNPPGSLITSRPIKGCRFFVKNS